MTADTPSEDVMKLAREIATHAAGHVRNNADAEAVENIVTSGIARALTTDRAASAARIERLTKALRYCGEAIDTGRSEPLFVARDLIRNTLDDDARSALEGK